ncbi:MAG: hypothetical protein JEZ06_24210 [Anaerolineaceae bacterium]|nr:hypothetical protein [Anaerolineaceae bacterium]
MTKVEIISIGSELLTGDIVDTNSQFIAKAFHPLGLMVSRVTWVHDNVMDISQAVQEAMLRASIVITTGGLGPTIDDPTREAIAQATGVDLVFLPELWKQINERFKLFDSKPTENNRQQAYIPKGSTPITNPVGTAPAFISESNDKLVISLPGVPYEMKYLLSHEIIPIISKKFNTNQIIFTKVIHTADIGESFIDELLKDLEYDGNPSIGVFAKPGLVDIKLTTIAKNLIEAQLITDNALNDIKNRLHEYIFGFDATELQELVLEIILANHVKIEVYESGFDHRLSNILSDWGFPIQSQFDISPQELLHQIRIKQNLKDHKTVSIFASLEDNKENYNLNVYFAFPEKNIKLNKHFPGTLERSIKRSIVSILNELRINLTKENRK